VHLELPVVLFFLQKQFCLFDPFLRRSSFAKRKLRGDKSCEQRGRSSVLTSTSTVTTAKDYEKMAEKELNENKLPRISYPR
jgi:hypothetical protein